MTLIGWISGSAVARAMKSRGSAEFWVLSILLVACFALGGSARGEVASLMVLRPLAILALGFGLWRLEIARVKAHWFVCSMAAAIVALPALHLVPLPPGIWNQLPGRDLVAEIDLAAGLGAIWRPLSLVPDATRNALYAALVPLAVVVLGIQLGPEQRLRLVPLVLLMGGISALLGLMQILSDANGPLYFYEVTNNGAAVGLFANRNHQALLLAMLFPMLAYLGREQSPLVRMMALLAGLVLIPLVLITGSRAGLLAAAIGLCAVPLIMAGGGKAESGDSKAEARIGRFAIRRRWLVPVVCVLTLIVLTVLLGRGTALERLLESSTQQEGRLQILPTLIAMGATYGILGAGMGSFERVFQVHEPDEWLDPAYWNHAHNDWLELVITGGAPALFLAIAAVAAWLICACRIVRSPDATFSLKQGARLGLAITLLVGLASALDYPLRVPSLSALFAMATLWAGCSIRQNHSKSAVWLVNSGAGTSGPTRSSMRGDFNAAK